MKRYITLQEDLEERRSKKSKELNIAIGLHNKCDEYFAKVFDGPKWNDAKVKFYFKLVYTLYDYVKKNFNKINKVIKLNKIDLKDVEFYFTKAKELLTKDSLKATEGDYNIAQADIHGIIYLFLDKEGISDE